VPAAAAGDDNPFLIRDESGPEVDDADGLPFACHICRAPFVAPVVTACGHYFCEACALARFRTDPSCAVCGKATQGLFNAAHKLAAKLRAVGQGRAGAGAAFAAPAAAPASSGWADVVDEEGGAEEKGEGKGAVHGAAGAGSGEVVASGVAGDAAAQGGAAGAVRLGR
jgi:hypothetical protein